MLDRTHALRVVLAAVLVPALAVTPAGAQPSGAAEPSEGAAAPVDTIGDEVARALYERGVELYGKGDYGNAKKLFIESLERSPRGPVAADALRMLRNANERLGIADLDAGAPKPDSRPGVGGQDSAPPDSAPIDPYADGGGAPVDPYAEDGGPAEGAPPDGATALQDPYGADGPLDPYGAAVEPALVDDDDRRRARRDLMLWGGGYGLLAGLALAGPEGDGGDVTGGAVLTGILGAATGVGLSYYAHRRYDLTPGQARTIGWAGAWGAYGLALFGDVVTGVGTSTTNEIYRSSALGGALGTGAGILMARAWNPSEADVSLTNSFGFYGTTAGLLLAVAIDPPTGEAYSLNGFIGAGVGLGVGLYMAQRYDVSRDRMLRIDLGALAGVAAGWVLFYPLIADDSTSGDEQAAGVVSLLAGAGGAFAGWYLTRGMDDTPGTVDVDAAPPAVVQRSGSGRWTLGLPALRPADNPRLATPSGRPSVAIDLLGGRF